MNKEELENELKELYNLLYKVAFSRLRNEEDTEDVIAETVYIVFKEIDKLKDRNKFKSWVLAILINECNRFYKQIEKDKILLDKAKCNIEVFDHSIEDVESINNFEILIKDLKVDEKEIFRLYYYDNYTLSEISKIIDESNNTVKSKLRRGKEKIKVLLKNSSKKLALILLISLIFTSGIAIARTIITNRLKDMNNYEIHYNKIQVDEADYNIDKNKLVVRIDFCKDEINKNNFNLYWKDNSIYLMNMNRNENVMYPENFKWIENDILEVTFFCKYMELSPNLTLHIVSDEEKSVTIVLKK